ncbi:hypothetical protein HBH75_094380 [Parastagonospora nodorum]|nr:hypothetical protein HBH75_094380 [Parastagonospora nodorum]KAH5314504.1 hypothetical protein HBI50_137720 [Parastagonospora nodorum]
MAPAHASQQTPGHINHLKNIAVVGANGTIGSHIVSELLEKNIFNITAITRAESKGMFADGVSKEYVDYSNTDTLVAALKGKDALVITMAVTAAKDTQAKLIRAAATAGVPWVLPNEFGMYNTDEAQNDTIGDSKTKDRALLQSLGLSYIGVTCGFWYEHSLSAPDLYDFDIAKREGILFDDGAQKINTSTRKQTGSAVAAILSLPLLPKDENDKSLTLNSYRNRMAFVASFALSQRDMLDSLQRVTNTSDSDWNISRVPAKERFAEAKQKIGKGNRAAFGRALYTRYFYDDAGLFEKTHGLDNEKLQLLKADLDEATKVAIGLQESGYWDNYGKH